MKRLLSTVLLAGIFLVGRAPADSIIITYVTALMGPNSGSGDNIYFTLTGPGTTITGIGGMQCIAWCSGPIPDLTSVGTSQVFISNFLSATVAGVSYDPNNDISLQCCLFSSSGLLSGSVSGFVGEGETFKVVNLMLPGAGSWNLQFDFFPASGGSPGYYQFVSGTFTAGTPPSPVPEPSTLGFVATGVMVALAATRRMRSLRY